MTALARSSALRALAALAALAATVWVSRAPGSRARWIVLAAAGAAAATTAAGTSHTAGRLDERVWLSAVDAVHQAAVAVWIPPGGTELSDEQSAQIEPLLRELRPDRADLILELLDRFDAAHRRAVSGHRWRSITGPYTAFGFTFLLHDETDLTRTALAPALAPLEGGGSLAGEREPARYTIRTGRSGSVRMESPIT